MLVYICDLLAVYSNASVLLKFLEPISHIRGSTVVWKTKNNFNCHWVWRTQIASVFDVSVLDIWFWPQRETYAPNGYLQFHSAKLRKQPVQNMPLHWFVPFVGFLLIAETYAFANKIFFTKCRSWKCTIEDDVSFQVGGFNKFGWAPVIVQWVWRSIDWLIMYAFGNSYFSDVQKIWKFNKKCTVDDEIWILWLD